MKVRIRTPYTRFYEKRGFRYFNTQECQQFVDYSMNIYSRDYLWLMGYNPETEMFDTARQDEIVPENFLSDMSAQDIEVLYLTRLSDLKDDSPYYRAVQGSVDDSNSYMIYDPS